MKKYIILVPGAVFLLIAAGMAGTTSSASAVGDRCYQAVVDAAWTETVEHEAVTHDETVTVIDEPAWTETIPGTEDSWIDQQWHVWPGGPIPNSDPDPSPTDASWQPVPADPNGPHAFELHTPNVPYDVSSGESGLASWFLWTATFVPGTPEHVIEHPAVTHDETTTVVDEEAWTETVEHPAVTHQERVPCDNPPEVEGEQETRHTNPPVVAGVQVQQQAPSRPSAPAVAVPTAVDSGL